MHGLLPLPGEVVWIRQRRWRVERALRDRDVVRLDVLSRDRRLTFLAPFDRPAMAARPRRPRRVRAQEALARLAHLVARAPDARLPASAMDANVDILAHQLEPVLASIAGQSRLLIADEVGLGKTIQAGLIIAELLRREAAPRVLVLVPASLRDQWTGELGARFRIDCLAADRQGLDAMTRAGAFGDNPWRKSGVWIASPDFIKQRHVIESLPQDPWDLLVIDEAHAVCGDSDRYDACHRVASRARRVVLLTATPHSGDETRFSRLLDLGRLGPAANDVTVFRRTRRALGWQSTRSVRWLRVALSDEESAVLAGLRAFERAVAGATREAGSEPALLLLSVFRKRALSTFAALSQSLARRLAWLGDRGPDAALEWTQPRLSFDSDDDAGEDERASLTAQTGLDPRRERAWLRRLWQLADQASRRESKVTRLAALINRTTEPVVVFTEFRDSLDVIERRLRFSRSVSVLHGGQDPAERRIHLQRFLDGSTSVLLATDVAGQGLNLQSRARWVTSLELPWNPARLEQRIGRVDRISQTRPTHFTLVVARHEAEDGVLAHLSRRVLSAQRSFSADALVSVVPAESDVRAALLLAREFPVGPPGRAVTISHRWRRPAVQIARGLVRRRALARQWRAHVDGGGAVWAHTTRLVSSVCGAAHSLFVFSVPLLNGNDELTERLVVALASLAISPDPLQDDALMREVRTVIERAVARRLSKATRAVNHTASAAIRRERVIAEACADTWPDEAQPGLFDERERRAFEAQLAAGARLAGASGSRMEGHAQRVGLRPGVPTLEVALVVRR